MEATQNSFRLMVKHPSAFVPVAMSLMALAILGLSAMLSLVLQGHGLVRQADEGTTAHLWQILMAGQLPVLLFFLVKWLPKAPKPAMCVLGLQVVAAAASVAPVLLLGL